MKIVDYYDFAKSSIKYVDNAYRQQSNGHLKNYVLIIPVKIDLGSWFSKGTEIRSK